MKNKIIVGHHHRRPVFVWLPQLTHPSGVPGWRLPCPRCKSTKHVIVKGWTQEGSRRGILRDSCCDIVGKYYFCGMCDENNKSKPKASVAPNAEGSNIILFEFTTLKGSTL